MTLAEMNEAMAEHVREAILRGPQSHFRLSVEAVVPSHENPNERCFLLHAGSYDYVITIAMDDPR